MFTQKQAKQLWKELFGWKVGDRVQIQGTTKILHGTIKDFHKVVRWNGRHGISIPCAIIHWDSQSPIPKAQSIPLSKLKVEEDG